MENNSAKRVSDSKINAALAFCDPQGTYARHAAVVMASIFANTKSSVCVYIVHDHTLTSENRAKLQETADSFKQEVRFTDIGNLLDETAMDGGKLTSGGWRGMLFRLLLHRLIDIPKIIYLDCDVIVNLDLEEMWSLDLGGHTLGAVRDAWYLGSLRGGKIPWRLRQMWRAMGVKEDEYFNSGVLLMDLDRIRENYDLLSEARKFNQKYGKAMTLPDQDFLNHIFAGDVCLLDEKFNHIIIPENAEEKNSPNIWHMTSDAKPWTIYTRPGIDDFYWHYLTMTPYGAEKDKLIHAMLSELSFSSYAHLHSSQCLSRLRQQLADNIFRGHIWTTPRILVLSALYACKKK